MAATGFTEKLLNEMFTKYRTEAASAPAQENIELEIRFKDITREAFETLYTAILNNPEFSNPSLECSVNIISENVYERGIGGKTDDTQYIRKITFKGSSVVADVYLQKARLMRAVHVTDYIKYSVGLSKESVSGKFSTNANAIMRFKLRVSFDYIGAPPHPAKWRFDLTAVKQGRLAEIGANLKTIKGELFTDALAPENFLRELNYNLVDTFEVEIEHIDRAHVVTIEDISIAKKVFMLINPQYIGEIAYQEEIYTVAKHIVTNPNILHLFKQPTHRLKQLSNQVIALSKNTYYTDIYPPGDYYLTDKADGQRAIVSINGNRCRIIRSDTMVESINGEFVPGEITIADAELIYNSQLVGGSGEKAGPFTLHIFDVMVFRNENVSASGLSIRAKYLLDAAKIIDALIVESGSRAQRKNYVRLDANNLEGGFREIYEDEYPYTVDGLIITEPDEPYFTTKNYKWKPYERNTIDFLAVKCPQKLLGIKPYEVKKDRDLYLLFVGINHQMREKLGIGFIPQYRHIFQQQDSTYYPIQFSPSANPLAYLYYHNKGADIDRQIIELGRNKENTEWTFHGIRTDRKMEKNYFGNDFRVAELTYLNYIDPFSFEELWQPSGSYFTKQAADIHTAPNKFKRFVISVLLKDNLSGSKWVIDEAAGRGGDLHRYQEIGVENALFIDVDPTAIAELIRRKFSVFAVKKRHIRNWFGDEKAKKGANESPKLETVTKYDAIHDVEYDKLIIKDVKSLTVHTLVADLKTPYKELIASTFQYGLNPSMVDGIICNFALHYLCDTIEHIRNLLMFNARMLKIGGVFIFTVMDGKSVFELLRDVPTGQRWESRERGVLKYAIKKNYVGNKLSSSGQMISVLMPFSDEMYEEPLCNIEVVIAEAARLGFEVEMNASMVTFKEKFARADRALYDRMTEEDFKYVSLYKYVSLRLVKQIKKNSDNE